MWLVWWVTRNGFDLTPRRKYLLGGLRLAAIIVVLAMMLCPGVVVRELNRQRSNVVVLLDRSESMQTVDAGGDANRLDAAAKTLEQLRQADFSGCKVSFYQFNQNTEPIKDADDMGVLAAFGGTDLKRAFATIDRDIGFSRTAAVIVLSDGLDHSGFSGSQSGLPVFAVRYGSELTTVPDLRIDTFRQPEMLSVNEEMSLDVPVALSGFPAGAKASLVMSVDGKREKAETLELKSGEVKTINLRHVFNTPGIHSVKLTLNRLEREAGYLNNERELFGEGAENKNNVAAYFPVLTNSFRPLVRQLSGSGKKFTAVYKVKGNTFPVLGSEVEPALRQGLPRTADAMKNIDLLVLGANREGLLSPAEEVVLEQYVNNGGNLILLGGTESFGRIPANSPLYRLMPVRSDRVDFAAGNFAVKVPEMNKNSFSARMAELCGGGAVLKGINRVDGVKDGAEVLLWAEQQSRYPLVASLNYGRGKVIAVLTNSLHLWGQGGRERDVNFGVFWEQMIAFAGSSRDDMLKISVNTLNPRTDERLNVSVTAGLPETELVKPSFSLTAGLFQVGDGKAGQRRTLVRQGPLFSAEFEPLKPGRYVLEVSCRGDGRELRKRYRLITAGNDVAEMSDLKVTNGNFLKYCTSGRVYGPEEFNAMRDDVLRTIRKNDIEREWYPVFETPWFFAAVLLLAGLGWGLRRRFNLF